MTREGAIKHRDVILAYADGADIEYYDYGTWRDTPAPQFDPRTEYRVKPKEEIIPMDFSDAERLISRNLRNKSRNFISTITAVDNEGAWINGSYSLFSELFKYYEFLDGSPIGKLSK